MTEIGEPSEYHASVSGVVLSDARVRRYSAVCGFGAGVPTTYPHVLARFLRDQRRCDGEADGSEAGCGTGCLSLAAILESLLRNSCQAFQRAR